MNVIDTETHLIGPGRLAPTPVCIQRCTTGDEDSAWIEHRETVTTESLIEMLQGEVGGHNLCFDLAVIGQHWPETQPEIWRGFNEGRYYCTMIAEKMHAIERGWSGLDPRTGRALNFSLSTLAAVYLAENMSGKDGDSWRFKYRALDEKTNIDDWPREARAYALLDVQYTSKIVEKQKNIYEIPDLARRLRAAWALHLAGCWGLRTDPSAVNSLARRVRDSIASARVVLQRGALIRENGTKDLKAIRERVAVAYGGQPPLTEKGGISTAKAVLAESGDSLLETLASISNDEKLASTYVPVLDAGTRLPINPHWNPIVNTGRTSCRSPNVQNQPREGGVRECYVPRNACQTDDGENRVYVQADYSIAELCSLAQVLLWKFGESKMAEALQAGRELHLDTASQIMGVSYEDAVRTKKTDETKKARQFAKILNFGAPGGLGASRLAEFAKSSYGVEMTDTKARELRDTWLSAYPEMTRYFREVGEMVELYGGKFTLVQARSKRIRGSVGYADGCNSPFQGLAADFALDALYHVQRACFIEKSSVLHRAQARVVAFVHDEIILEARESLGHECALELQAIMERRAQAWLPDIPIKAEPCLMRRWSKDAEAVWHRGRLVPYEDADDLAREQVESELIAAGIIEDPEMDGGLLG